jgi:hypothetical protein
LPLTAVALCKSDLPASELDPDGDRYGALQQLLVDLEITDDEQASTYEPLQVDPDGLAPPVDFSKAVDSCAWIALIAAGKLSPEAIRTKITSHERKPLLLNLGFVPDLAAPALEDIEACRGDKHDGSGRAMEWQISTGRRDANTKEPIYASLSVPGDTTDGLEREGVVRLQLPVKSDDIGVFDVEPHELGARDFPPAIDEKVTDKVIAWIRAFRRDGSPFGKVQWIGANVSCAIQQRKANTVFLGTGDGQPDQEVTLLHAPVLPNSLVLEVEELDGWTAWAEVEGFHASGEDDRHYVLDHATGRVRFGTGLQGRTPQFGERIRAKTWLWGGGSQGNVASGAIGELVGVGKVEVDNPLAAWGGAAGETIAEALTRIPGELRRRDRCVTKNDFTELALQTPGTDLARAEALPRFHPHERVTDAAGVVSVVVWPRVDPIHPNAPMPDRRTLERVCEWLDTRRLITTELYVIPPRYRKIAVAIGLVIKRGYPIEGVRRWAELIVRQYLAPVPPYGPEGRGWGLGRRVVAGELEAAVLQVEGVEYVRQLRLARLNEQNEWEEIHSDVESQITIELDHDQVVELAEITVVDGPAMEPGKQIGPLQPGKPPVPVPIEREDC